MADGVLGLGSGQAASLNNELIEKLKTAERASTVAPIETYIEDIEGEGGESEKVEEIIAKANKLLDSIKSFDLFVSGGITAFDQKSATTSGSSVVFDAVDETSLNEGTTTVSISTLAKRDVFQSTEVDAATKDADISKGDLTIAFAGSDGLYSTSVTFDTTGKTYDELASEINLNSNLTASVEQVSDSKYKLVIKSAESGTSNALKITGEASASESDGSGLGYTTDGTIEAASANIQEATNLAATVNGIAYNVSSNVITVDGGLKITAVEIGDSSISIESDTSTISTSLENFTNEYNELVALIDEELYSADSKISDKSSLRTVMSGIKDIIFSSYGTQDDLNVFNLGFEIDENGYLSIDSEVLNNAIENNIDDLKSLFLGVAEDEGLGTKLKTYLDDLDGYEGLLSTYQDSMNSRKEALEDEKESAIEALDNKYDSLAAQFAAYNTLITQYENAFSGLSLMIEQSTSS